MRPNGTPQQLENRRRQAITMMRSGKTYRDVAKALNSSLSSVVRWWQTYQNNGHQGIRSQAKWGRPPHLADHQKQHLKKILLKGAISAGYTTDLWTLKRIAQLIRKEYRIHYTNVGVWKLLRLHFGWSCQKPEKRALQRDEKVIAEWKAKTWPLIKKSPKTWGPSCVSG